MKPLATLGLLVLLSAPLAAAPPLVNYLYPAGGQRGTTVGVLAEGTFSPWPVQAWVDGKGIDIRPGKGTGKLSVTIAPDAEPGTYRLRLFNAEGASTLRPFIVGTLPEVLEKEPNDEPTRPHVLASSTMVVNGRLDKQGDADVFALKLQKGQTLVASLEAYRTLRSPMDGILQVLTADGSVLEQNNDYKDLDPQLTFTVPADGTYLVRLFAFPSVPDSAIRLAGKDTFIYRLTLTTGGFVDHPYPLAVSREQPGTVAPVGWNIPEDLRSFPVPTPKSFLGEAKLFHPRLANPFFVRLEPNPTLAATHAKEPQDIPLPATISGWLKHAGDSNVFRFAAKKGEKLPFRIEARKLGFALDPVLRVKDLDGKVLAQAQAKTLGADPPLDFTVPQDAQYLLEVRDFHAGGGPRHLYRLRAGQEAPDFELKVPGDRFGLTPGQPLDIPVTVDRRGGLKGDILLDVEGLPAAVTAMTAGTSAAGKPLTLRLTAPDKTYFSGPIRIAGKLKGKDEPVRHAQATLAEFGVPTEHLWLTVPGKNVTAPPKKKKGT